MDKLISKPFAVKIILVGACLFLLGFLLTLPSLSGLYDSTTQCLSETTQCQTSLWQEAAVQTGSLVIVAGYLTIAVGILDYLIVRFRKK